MQSIIKFLKDEDGVTAIEYAILAAALVAGLAALGGGTFAKIATAIDTAITNL